MIGNDGILDGFKVLEDFDVTYDVDSLSEEDAEDVKDEWKEAIEKKLVKCKDDDGLNVTYRFKKGDKVYFEYTPLTKGLVMQILKEHSDKIKELY